MYDNGIAFPYSTCNKIPDKLELIKNNFEVVGFEAGIEWSDFQASNLPSLDEKIWARSNNPPLKGDRRIVMVRYPFQMTVGESFWMLFMPALSYFNGWKEHPSEINSSAFVNCSFEQILSRNDECPWIEIRILNVVLLKEACDIWSDSNGSSHLDSFQMFRDIYVLHYNEWILISASTESDLGTWALIKKKNERHHLIALGEWGFHYDIVYGGNKIISKDELNKLLRSSVPL
ncbi:hypothetical protein ABNX05_02215 [Lysinibacillus sp. M3]|uniref:Uncharacterized protein n=1 Tax=Lysinibacillus zambalensis TaxID=3160866 RepID=A0ABV1MLN4_9BACI